jgi:hypothetical protein
MPKARLAAASIPEWPKTASKSLLWFPRPAHCQWELLNIFGKKKTYKKKKKFFFSFFDSLYICVELIVILEFTDLKFSNNSALNFVRIYCAHPVDATIERGRLNRTSPIFNDAINNNNKKCHPMFIPMLHSICN